MLEQNAAERIHRVEVAHTNFYLVEDDGKVLVVDACVPTAWGALLDALAAIGRAPADVSALVLTHGHFDHIGFAERARQELGIPVWVHENDVPLTRRPRSFGREAAYSYYLLTQVQALPIVASLARHRAWWPPPIESVERFADGALPVPGSPRVLFTPGHTLGHVALHFPDRDAVIAGDAVVTLDPYRAMPGPKIVSRAATADTERALASLDRLTESGATTVLTGHGPVWREGVEAAVARAREIGPT